MDRIAFPYDPAPCRVRQDNAAAPAGGLSRPAANRRHGALAAPLRRALAAALVLASAVAETRADPAPPLVTVEWLQPRVCRDPVMVLDLRRSLRNFEAEHIPCAVHSDYYGDGWRTSANMIPPPERLEALVSRLGIGSDSHVILATAAVDEFSAAEVARVYLIFRLLGHDAVSILDGGVPAWTADWRNDVDSGPADRAPASFRARPRDDIVADRAAVVAALAAGAPLVDMRPNDHFLGINRSPALARSGAIPGAVNLPMSWIVEDGGLRFRTPEQLRRLWRAAGVPAAGPQILLCNSGLESAVGWFAAAVLLGNAEARLYDGSLAEWSADPSLPMDVRIPLPPRPAPCCDP